MNGNPLHVTVTGDAAQEYLKRLEAGNYILKDYAYGVTKLIGPQRTFAELQLTALIGNMLMEEKDVQVNSDGKFRTRFDYHLHLYTNGNKDILRAILLDERPLVINLQLPSRTETYHFGYVWGFSCVIPSTFAGYQAYMKNDICGYEFDKCHMLDDLAACRSCYYLFLHHFVWLPALGGACVWPFSPTLNHLLLHMLVFLPEMDLTTADELVPVGWSGGSTPATAIPDDQFPVLWCATRGGPPEKLARMYGFIKPTGFPKVGKADTHPDKWELRLCEYNKLGPSDNRKKKIRRFLKRLMRVKPVLYKCG